MQEAPEFTEEQILDHAMQSLGVHDDADVAAMVASAPPIAWDACYCEEDNICHVCSDAFKTWLGVRRAA